MSFSILLKAVNGSFFRVGKAVGRWRPGFGELQLKLGGETEAGTIQRDVVRFGAVNISMSFSVSSKWLKLLTGFKQREKFDVEYFDTETLERKRAEMFDEEYMGLVKDTSYKWLWKVPFTLREF